MPEPTPEKLIEIIQQLSPAVPNPTLSNLCDAIATLPSFEDVKACVTALMEQTGHTLPYLVAVSPELGERVSEWVLEQAGHEAKAILEEIQGLGKDGPPTDAKREDLVARIAGLPGKTEREYLTHALARKLKSNPKFIAKMVAEARGENPDPKAVGRPVKELLPDAPVSDSIHIPAGYTISKTGAIIRLHSDETREVNPYPILIASEVVARLGETTVTRSRLVFRLPNVATGEPEWAELVAEPAVFMDPRKILSLTNQRLPITHVTAKATAEWLSAFRIENNGLLPVVHSVPAAGWWELPPEKGQPADLEGDALDMERLVFLWGSQAISRKGVGKQESVRLDPLEGDMTSLLAAMHTRGTLKDWIQETWPLTRDRPIARMRLYASLASPLVRLVGAAGHLNHSVGHSTLGKTIVAQWAMSPWGNPGGPEMPPGPGLMRSWDITKVGAERLFAFLNNIPAYLDDNPQTTGAQDFVLQQRLQDIIMTLANGIGRVRGGLDGKIQMTRKWHLNVLSTNEQAIRDVVARDGAAVRTIDLWGSPIVRVDEHGNEVEENEESLRAVGDKIRAATARNFGWAPRYLADVMKYNVDEIRAMFKKARMRFYEALQQATGNTLGRLEARTIDYYALMLVAAGIWHEDTCAGTMAGGEEEALTAYKMLLWVFLRNAERNELVPAYQQVYEYVYGWVVANKESFYGHWEDVDGEEGWKSRQPPGGWFGKWHVNVETPSGVVPCFAIFPHKLQEVLSRANQPLATMTRLWRDAGLLIPDNDGKNLRRRVSLENWKQAPRMFVFRRSDDEPEGSHAPRF